MSAALGFLCSFSIALITVIFLLKKSNLNHTQYDDQPKISGLNRARLNARPPPQPGPATRAFRAVRSLWYAPKQLPPEIADTIIDFLHNDKRALAACALVSRSFLPSSQYHLFRKIKFTPPYHQTGFNELLKWIKEHPDLCRYVKELYLFIDSTDFQRVERRVRPVVDAYLLFPVLKRLENLQKLKISGVSLGGPHRALSASAFVLVGPRRLRHLAIKNIEEPEPCRSEDIVDILSLFSDVDRLDIVNFRCHVSGAELPAPPFSLRVGSLNLDVLRHNTARYISGLLAQDPPETPLRDLSVSLRDFGELGVPSVGSLIRVFGPKGLERLSLSLPRSGLFSRDAYTPDTWYSLSLLSCTSLKEITFRLHISGRPTSNSQRLFDAMLLLLTSIPTAQLHSISIHIFTVVSVTPDPVRIISHLSTCPWKQLEEAAESFPNLREVKVGMVAIIDSVIRHLHAFDSPLIFIRGELQHLHSKGLLQIL